MIIPQQSTKKVACMRTGKHTQARTKKLVKRSTGAVALKSIRQKTRETAFMIPRTRFANLAKEVLQNIHGGLILSTEAAEHLQQAAEEYLGKIFKRATEISCHDGRSTLLPRDFQLSLKLQEEEEAK